MWSPAQLTRILAELLLLLLGVLLLILTLTGHYRTPQHSTTWLVLGVVLVYWGARVWGRRGRSDSRWEQSLRSGSFILLGATMLMIALRPADATALLIFAGAILALRGLAGAALALRAR